MKNNTTLHSIKAGMIGVIVGVSLSLTTDKLLVLLDILPKGNLNVSTSLIWFVLFYRTMYNILSFYLVAKFSPRNPMKHTLILGAIGTIISILGAIATINMDIGPMWYAWTLALLTMPAAYTGWRIFKSLSKK